MMIPKSIKFQSNLTEAEIRAYYSLKPLDEDYEVHQKRFNKVISEYLEGRKFKNSNAKACYKSQLKTLIKEGKTNTPKYESFNMWRFSRIQFYISKAKDYELQQREKNTNIIASPRSNDNQLIYENQQLKQEIENLKKQLIEKDNEIESLKNKPKVIYDKPVEEVVEEVEVEEVIYSQVFITSDDEEEEVIFSEEEESEEEESEEEESEEEESEEEEIEDEVIDVLRDIVSEIEKPYLDKNMCIEVYHKTCLKEVDIYHQEYMKLKEGKTNKEITKITNDIKNKFFEEVVEINLNKLDDIFDLPFDEYEELQKKTEEELKHKILYFSD
jgi:hypothetical protein